MIRYHFGRPLMAIIAVDGLLWLRSSYGKIASGKFVDGMSGTLKKFASENPYPWMKNFLEQTAQPNSQLFGYLTMYGELLSALAIVSASLYLFFKPVNKLWVLVLILGLIGASFLNLVFYFSAGWTSSSTESVNLLMLAVQIVGTASAFRVLATAK